MTGREWMTVSEVARLLGIGSWNVRYWIANWDLPAWQKGNLRQSRYMIRAEDFLAFYPKLNPTEEQIRKVKDGIAGLSQEPKWMKDATDLMRVDPEKMRERVRPEHRGKDWDGTERRKGNRA